METEVILQIVSVVFLVVTAVFGKEWLKAKKVIGKITKAFVTLNDATEDNEITEEEWKLIYEDFKDIVMEVAGKDVIIHDIKLKEVESQ